MVQNSVNVGFMLLSEIEYLTISRRTDRSHKSSVGTCGMDKCPLGLGLG